MNSLKPLLDFYDNNPSRWVQNTSAKNVAGEIVNEFDYTACSWCLFAATLFVFRNNILLRTHALKELKRRIGEKVDIPMYICSIPIWNDSKNRIFKDIVDILSEEDIGDPPAILRNN